MSEVNQVLEDIKRLGPAFQQVADATAKIRDIFADSKPKMDNLLVEMQNAAEKTKEI